LFVVEIFYFILLPIFRELRQWFEQRESIMQTKRSRITLLVGLALVAWAFMPVLGTVRLPAVLHAQNEQQIYPRVAGQLERFAVTAGQEVRRGDVLVRLSSDQLQLEMRLASQRHDLLQRRLIMAAQDATLKAQTRILEREIASVQRELEGLAAKERELMITADLDGTVVDLEPTLSPGQYVPSGARLFIIRGGESQALTGFVQETDVARLSTSTTGRFVPDNARLPTVPVTLSAIRRTAAIKLEHLELSETQGGSIPLQEGGDTASNIDGSYYRADFAPAAASDLRISSDQTVRGVIHLDAEARSFARIVFERVWSVLIRESGF
ncbi:MAG: biotin/lipoyl-binding protein, partial [Pseudomonadota bacterium]